METGRRLIFRQTGAPAHALELESFDIEKPGKDEVLVKMLAAPINPADVNTIEGTYGIKPALPATPGTEGYGIVEASHSGNFLVGDRVIFLKRAGSWATHVKVPGNYLFNILPEIDPFQAAMLKVNPATAWQLLHSFAELKTGDYIVQNAGNSAVGRCVIQLALSLGIKTISFVRRAETIPELIHLGAEQVFIDDEGGRARAKEYLEGANAALAFNAVGGDSALALMKLLRAGGTLVTFGAMSKRPAQIPNGMLIFRDIHVRGLWITRWLETSEISEISEIYGKLTALVASKNLIQKVDSTFPIENFGEAFARLENPSRNGKILFHFK